jgi:hypothetical protein
VEITFGVDISNQTRQLKFIEARACYYALCYQFTPYNKTQIANSLDKHHATVIHALKEFPNMMAYNKKLRLLYNQLKIEIIGKEKGHVKPISKMNINELLHAYNMAQLAIIEKNEEIKKCKEEIKNK